MQCTLSSYEATVTSDTCLVGTILVVIALCQVRTCQSWICLKNLESLCVGLCVEFVPTIQIIIPSHNLGRDSLVDYGIPIFLFV
jgi:hypothetical protein